MKRLTLTLFIDPAEAVRKGVTEVGETTIVLYPRDLEQLSDTQTDTLARHIAGEPYYGSPLTQNAKPVGDASMVTVKELLDTRAIFVEKQQNLDRQRQAEFDREALKFLNDFTPPETQLYMDPEGNYSFNGATYKFPVRCPYFEENFFDRKFSHCTPEVKKLWEERKEELAAQTEALVQSKIPAAKKFYEEKAEAERAQNKAKLDQEARDAQHKLDKEAHFEEMARRLPQLQREKIEAGLASTEETTRRMSNLILMDWGLEPLIEIPNQATRIYTLSDGDYVAFQELENMIPKEAQVHFYEEDGQVYLNIIWNRKTHIDIDAWVAL